MRVMAVLARRDQCNREGEVLQLLNAHNFAVTEAAYLEVIRRKTAKLFEAAAQLGAISARRAPSSSAALRVTACISERRSS